MPKGKSTEWKAGDLALDTVFRNYLRIVSVTGEEAVVEYTQEGLAGEAPFSLPLARLMAMPSDG